MQLVFTVPYTLSFKMRSPRCMVLRIFKTIVPKSVSRCPHAKVVGYIIVFSHEICISWPFSSNLNFFLN